MSSLLLSSDDHLLKEAFAAYLKLPVFPVSLEYSPINGQSCLVEPSRSHLTHIWNDANIQEQLIEWVESHRVPYFLKSDTFIEYCFCRQLRNGKCNVNNFCQFKCFQSKLVGTKGHVYLELWLKLKSLFSPSFPLPSPPSLPLSSPSFSVSPPPLSSSSLSPPPLSSSSLSSPSLSPSILHDYTSTNIEHFDFEKLSLIRSEYGQFLKELKMPLFPVYTEDSSKIKWCLHIMSQLSHRLTDYWWLRFSSHLCLQDCTHERHHLIGRGENEEEFVSILSSESSVGRPFLSFLCRNSLKEEVSLYHLLQDINNVLKHDKNHLQFKRAVIGCANKYRDTIFQSLNMTKMFQHLTDPSLSLETVKDLLFDVKENLTINLRRKWTSFLHEDYESFCSCFPSAVHMQLLPSFMCPSTNFQMTESQTCVTFDHQNPVSKCVSRNERKFSNFQKVEVTLSMSDLIGTPLSSLSNNSQALEDFKTFLADRHGLESLEYTSLDVWLSVLIHKKVPKTNKSAHARKIFRNFLSPNAKVPAFTWKSDKPIPKRPGTPFLEDIQMQAFENFADNLIEFLKLLHNNDSTHSNSRPSTDMRFFESTFDDDDISFKDLNHVGRKLHQFLITNTTEKSQRMEAFERFLIKQGPPDCPHFLLNSIHYWMEVHTFQSLQKGSPDVNFLAKKIIALVNRYVDTSTPPWVKIAISNEMAQNLTDRAASLSVETTFEEVEVTAELLAKSKMVVLSHLVQYWIEFNRVMTDSPAHTSINSTESKSSLTSKASVRILRLPTPPTDGRKSASVLTFSRQDGLQWKY